MKTRQEVEREMGSAFDLCGYHQAILAQGSVPVRCLPELVRSALQTTP